MPLILCTDCRTEVSTAATSCPKCGCPVKFEPAPVSARDAEKKSMSLTNQIGVGLLFGIVVSIGVFHFQSNKEQARAEAAAAAEIERIRNLPELPIDVTYREAMMGAGLVAQFKNTSEKHLAVIVKLKNPTMGSSSTLRLDIAPQESKEVGHLEGWTFASGDLIEISRDGYKDISVEMP